MALTSLNPFQYHHLLHQVPGGAGGEGPGASGLKHIWSNSRVFGSYRCLHQLVALWTQLREQTPDLKH